MKTIIERGASWTIDETKLLLGLWGQDLLQRQATKAKRTREVYEKMSERFNQSGYERTAEQVRTRVFNMIAEYRRILKDPNREERAKRCMFFEALHKIYQARHMDDIKSALDDYEPDISFSPASNTISSEKGDESISDSEATDCNETINNTAANASSSISNSASSTSHNSNNNNNNDNYGDSNNNSNNNADKESANATNSTSSASKRIKLGSPKASSSSSSSASHPSASNANSASNSSSAAASTATNNNNTTSNSTSDLNNSSSSKQKSSSSATPIFATTLGGAVGPTQSSNSTSSSSSSSSTSQRHQSLLLPHATGSSTSAANSTPMSKIPTSAGATSTPSYININSAKLPIIRTNQLIGHSNGNESLNLNGTATRLPTTAITSHQLYQAPVNTFDVTSSALLIDRMFAHLSRESENMREWIALEKERLALERARRQQETEREVRRERVLIDTLMRFQEQWLSFLTRLNPQLTENSPEPPPELKIPKESSSSSTSSVNATLSSTQQNESSLQHQQSTAATTTNLNSNSTKDSNPPNPTDISK